MHKCIIMCNMPLISASATLPPMQVRAVFPLFVLQHSLHWNLFSIISFRLYNFPRTHFARGSDGNCSKWLGVNFFFLSQLFHPCANSTFYAIVDCDCEAYIFPCGRDDVWENDINNSFIDFNNMLLSWSKYCA